MGTVVMDLWVVFFIVLSHSAIEGHAALKCHVCPNVTMCDIDSLQIPSAECKEWCYMTKCFDKNNDTISGMMACQSNPNNIGCKELPKDCWEYYCKDNDACADFGPDIVETYCKSKPGPTSNTAEGQTAKTPETAAPNATQPEPAGTPTTTASIAKLQPLMVTLGLVAVATSAIRHA